MGKCILGVKPYKYSELLFDDCQIIVNSFFHNALGTDILGKNGLNTVRRVFRTLSKIYDETFFVNSEQLSSNSSSVCPGYPHIETSQLICFANQMTGFYMRATLTLNGLTISAKYSIIHVWHGSEYTRDFN